MNYSKLSDEKLVLAIQENQGEGYGEIIERYQERLLRYATTLCQDSETAKDVVQETFLSAYQNINSFDTDRQFSSWIYRIAHNKAINEWRRHKNVISLWDIKEMEGAINASEITQKIDQRDLGKKIRKQILRLPLKYRDPLVLRHYEERSYEEISDILKIPVGTVGVRIKRGLEKIRKEIDIKTEDYL